MCVRVYMVCGVVASDSVRMHTAAHIVLYGLLVARAGFSHVALFTKPAPHGNTAGTTDVTVHTFDWFSTFTISTLITGPWLRHLTVL